jgi:drug/metabolite transporter (DMT)-like permease
MTSRDLLLYALTVIAWSTSWIGVRLQLGVVAPEVSLVWRFGLATILMFAWAMISGAQLAFPARVHARFALLGLLIFGLNFLLFYYGGLTTPSGLLAVVFSTASLFNLVLARPLLGQPIERRVLIGAVLGSAGVLAMFAPRILAGGDEPGALKGLAFCIAGTLSFCLGNMVSATIQRSGVRVVSASTWGMLYGTLLLAMFAAVRGQAFIVEPTLAYIGALLWLSIVASVIAFAAYLTLLGRIGAGRAGYATVLFPVFALMISTVAEDYRWTAPALLGLVLVLVGNVVVLRR